MISCPTTSPVGSLDRGRNDSGSDTVSSEASPLEVDANAIHYATFSERRQPKQMEHLPYYWWLPVFLSSRQKKPVCAIDRRYPLASRHNWKLLYATLVLAGLLAAYYQQEQEYDPYCHYYNKPIVQWDHNIYVNPTSSSQSHNYLLVAQMNLVDLTTISSRPNRAYARQHVVDYVLYSNARHISKVCFDKVILLNMILDQQTRETDQDRNPIPPFLFSQRISYHAVALLAPDSIITSMDSDIFDLLPPDKLVAIAGWSDDTSALFSKTDVIFFNLRHKYANSVAKLWWDWVSDMSCGAGNDLTLLVDAISAVVLEQGETLSSVIAPLKETERGFVSRNTSRVQDYVIKGIVPVTPEPRARLLLNDPPAVRLELQTTADSVCYRYYPRCEVL